MATKSRNKPVHDEAKAQRALNHQRKARIEQIRQEELEDEDGLHFQQSTYSSEKWPYPLGNFAGF